MVFGISNMLGNYWPGSPLACEGIPVVSCDSDHAAVVTRKDDPGSDTH